MNEMEVKACECVEEAIEVTAETATKGTKIVRGAIVVLGIGALAAGVVALARKYKGKKTEFMIKKLEKQGYIVTEKIFDDDASVEEIEDIEE